MTVSSQDAETRSDLSDFAARIVQHPANHDGKLFHYGLAISIVHDDYL